MIKFLRRLWNNYLLRGYEETISYRGREDMTQEEMDELARDADLIHRDLNRAFGEVNKALRRVDRMFARKRKVL